MKTNYIFIVGVQKGGTTALAGWLVGNGLAAYAVPGVKEPANFLRFGLGNPLPPPRGDLPLIDASTAYFGNAKVVARLPEHRVRLVVCLRNPLERTWSAYRMMKLIAQQAEGASEYLQRFHAAAGTPQALEREAWYRARRDVVAQGYPRASARQVERHYDAEAARLAGGSFAGRLDYELAFRLARGDSPFFSVLAHSFYYRGLRMLLEKYQPEDVAVVTLDRLRDAESRARLVERLTGRAEAGPELGVSFSLGDVAFDEPEPAWSGAPFDALRSAFAYDVAETLKLLDGRGVATDLVDRDRLARGLG